jgi:hypothetical protein
MFKFGRTYEPNKYGRIYPKMSPDVLYQKIIEVSNIINERTMRGSGNWVIVSSRYFDR